VDELKLLDLFCGTKSISKVFERHGHETFTVDILEEFNPDLPMNILEVTPEMILEKFGRPDVIWASPPCFKFSVAAIGKNWIKNDDGTYTPKNEGAVEAMEIVKHTLYLIKELKPKYFFIENPRGMLRKMPFMQEYPRFTVTYCQYGDTRMKPTDIWTNFEDINFKPPCKNGDPCHEAAPRGSQTGTQGLKNAKERAVVPEGLCDYIRQRCEEKLGK
jgi:site-specific DNA-cytosine methylase